MLVQGSSTGIPAIKSKQGKMTATLGPCIIASILKFQRGQQYQFPLPLNKNKTKQLLVSDMNEKNKTRPPKYHSLLLKLFLSLPSTSSQINYCG